VILFSPARTEKRQQHEHDEALSIAASDSGRLTSGTIHGNKQEKIDAALIQQRLGSAT
jgi:hypothetical protein